MPALPTAGSVSRDVSRFSHTMTFGDPKDFAIEAYHEPSGPQWAGFGRMAIDIQGVRLGDIRENHCSLFHAVDRFRLRVDADLQYFVIVDGRVLGHGDSAARGGPGRNQRSGV